MRIDPLREARRLLSGTDPSILDQLASNPAAALQTVYSVSVELRSAHPNGEGCAVDGTYTPGPPPVISVASDMGPARRRFTILHELGHHLIEQDTYLADLPTSDDDRRDEEICNEVAATVLIPDDVIEEVLADSVPTGERVARLHETTSASREACCVAASRRLRRPGCVILGTPDGQAVFTAHHPATPWRIARGTYQGNDSLVAQAAGRSSGHARGETRVRFASGAASSQLHGDAFTPDQRWVFAVIADDSHSPWKTGLNLGIADRGPHGVEIECANCDEASLVFTAPCLSCGDRTCPKCGRCSCPLGPRSRQCVGCFLEKPPPEFPGASADLCLECTELSGR